MQSAFAPPCSIRRHVAAVRDAARFINRRITLVVKTVSSPVARGAVDALLSTASKPAASDATVRHLYSVSRLRHLFLRRLIVFAQADKVSVPQ